MRDDRYGYLEFKTFHSRFPEMTDYRQARHNGTASRSCKPHRAPATPPPTPPAKTIVRPTFYARQLAPGFTCGNRRRDLSLDLPSGRYSRRGFSERKKKKRHLPFGVRLKSFNPLRNSTYGRSGTFPGRVRQSAHDHVDALRPKPRLFITS